MSEIQWLKSKLRHFKYCQLFYKLSFFVDKRESWNLNWHLILLLFYMLRFFLHGQAIILVIISAPPIKQVSISNKFAHHSLLQQFEKVSLSLSCVWFGIWCNIVLTTKWDLNRNGAFCSRRDLAGTDNARPDRQLWDRGIDLCHDFMLGINDKIQVYVSNINCPEETKG